MDHYPRLRQTVLDAEDVRTLAEFYRQLLGATYRPGDEPPAAGLPDDDDWLVIRLPGTDHELAFQLTETLTPTTWPDPAVPMQLHLDLTLPDVESLVAQRDRALALGGRMIHDELDDDDEPLVVIADPAGHPFCLFVG